MTTKKQIFFLIIILLTFASVELYYISKGQNLIWDSSVYLGNGKFLFSAGNSGFYEVIRPPLLPFLLGVLWKINLPLPLSALLLSLAFSLAYLILTYSLTKELIGSKEAVIAALLLVLTPMFINYSYLVLTEIPSTVAALGALYLWVKKKNTWICGILAGTTFLFRYPSGLILAVLCILIFWEYTPWKKRLYDWLKLMIGFVMMVLPYTLFLVTYHLNPIETIYSAGVHQSNLAESVPGIENLIFYPKHILSSNLLFIFSIFGLVIITKKIYTQQESLSEWLVVLLPLAVFLTYYTIIINKQPRFALTFLPYISIIAAYAITSLGKNKKKIVRWITYGSITIFVILISMQFQQQIHIPYSFQPLRQHLTKVLPPNEIIFSTTPITAALVDNPHILVYNTTSIVNYDNREEALEYFEQSSIQWLIFTPTTFWCSTDTICTETNYTTTATLQKKYSLVLEDQYFNEPLYVFKK